MRKLKAPIIKIIVLLLLISGCNNDKVDVLVFGVFCGECYSNCASLIVHYNDSSFIDKTDLFFRARLPYNPITNDNLTRLPDSTHNYIKSLSLNFNPLNKTKNVTGCPDCYDQCGYFFRLNNDTWKIDPDNHPNNLNNLLVKTDKAISYANKSLFKPDKGILAKKAIPDSLELFIVTFDNVIEGKSPVLKVYTEDKKFWKCYGKDFKEHNMVIKTHSIVDIIDSNLYGLKELVQLENDTIEAIRKNGKWILIYK